MMIDPQLASLLAHMQRSGLPPLHQQTVQQARAFFDSFIPMYGHGAAMADVRDLEIPSPAGSLKVRALVPQPRPRGVIVYLHGGGWVCGSIAQYDTLGRKLAACTGYTVVLVEYRLAPEHPFPAALDDAWTATVWAAEQLPRLAGPALPLVVAGDSAGGNLAAVVALRARDLGGPRLAMQLLVYPVVDTDLRRPSYLDPTTQMLLTRDDCARFLQCYVPDMERRTSRDVAPLRAPDLTGLPATVMITAEFDPLRDEGEAYAARLVAAGVPVSFRRFRRQPHGFFQLTNILDASDRAVEFLAAGVAQQTPALDI